MNIKNKIVKYGTKPADQFTANPLNWRKHPQQQRIAVQESLKELGWIGVVVENIQTGNILDGHERVMQALKDNEDVPYIQVDLTPEEEKLALAVFDKITNMAIIDEDIFEQLKSEINIDNEILSNVINDEDFDYTIFAPEAGEGEKEIDENIPTEHECPSCGYKW